MLRELEKLRWLNDFDDLYRNERLDERKVPG